MGNAYAILVNTPWWVFLLFALLVWLGGQALRPRTLSLRRVFITPGIFILWGVVALAGRVAGAPLLLADWLVLAAIGGALAVATVRLGGLGVDRRQGLVHFPGSVLPLLRNVAIFAAKYALAVALTFHPASRVGLSVADVAVSGLSAGYFLGWVARFVLAWRRAPDSDLSAVAPTGAMVDPR